VKSFRLQNKLVETRLFMRHPDGVWAGYTYRWNDQQTEANRVRGGAAADVAGQTWMFPSEAQCLQCHTQGAGRSLGLEVAQLNGNLTYAATGRTANQLTTLDEIGVFSPRLSPPAAQQPAYVDPYGGAGTLGDRARAYLHTNCAGCHRPGGSTPSPMDLRFQTALNATNACNVDPQAGDLGVAGARIILPGEPGRSLVVLRAERRDAAGMPPLASHVVDAQGVQLLRDWIAQLGGC
jgi:mono/diheme cytochrome c family protein